MSYASRGGVYHSSAAICGITVDGVTAAAVLHSEHRVVPSVVSRKSTTSSIPRQHSSSGERRHATPTQSRTKDGSLRASLGCRVLEAGSSAQLNDDLHLGRG